MALHKVIVNNDTLQCLGSVSDGLLPSDLDSSEWSLQNYNYDNPDVQLEPFDYTTWETNPIISMAFKDGQIVLEID